MAQLAGVAATAWLVWSDTILPRLAWQPASALAEEALFYVLLAWAGATGIAFAVYLAVSLADLPEVVAFSWRSAAPAMWFAPAVILMSTPVPGAFLVSVIMVGHATRQLISRWVTLDDPAAEEPSPRRSRVPAMMAACAAQFGLVARLWSRPMASAVLLAASAAILTLLALHSGAYKPTRPPLLPPSVLSVVVTFLLALTVFYGGLRVRFAIAEASGNPPSVKQAVAKVAEPAQMATAMGGDFPGVILLPPTKPHTVILVPIAPPRLSGATITRPVGIPFSGEYWMYRWPWQHPPPRSFISHARPSDRTFHTTDGASMQMEAWQRLGAPADPRCCSRIQLTIADPVRRAGPVSLEMILADTESGASESLGPGVLASTTSFEQVLTYSLARAAGLRQFDEIRIVFHRDPLFMDRSATVDIERFVFLP